jgi:hypothetical protein
MLLKADRCIHRCKRYACIMTTIKTRVDIPRTSPDALAELEHVVPAATSKGSQSVIGVAGTTAAQMVVKKQVKAAAAEVMKDPATLSRALEQAAQHPRVPPKVAAKMGTTAATLATKLGGEAAQGAAAKTAQGVAAKALPIVGNVLSAAGACVAGFHFLKSIATGPRDMEKIVKEGAHFLGQAAGIAVPWVGMGSSVANAAWDAKIANGEQDTGTPEAVSLMRDSAGLLKQGLTDAGLHEVATQVNPDKITHQADLMKVLEKTAAGTEKKLAEVASDPNSTAEQRDELRALSEGFAELHDVLKTHHQGGSKLSDSKKRELDARLQALTSGAVPASH